MTNPIRTLVVHCVDWSVLASGHVQYEPVAVIKQNRVVVCSDEARNCGVEIGQRRRSAQAACPDLLIVQDDQDRDMHAFSSVVKAIEEWCPFVQILEPGTCALAVRGPAGYFGGEGAVVAQLHLAVSAAIQPLGGMCVIGIAESLFAARLAAERSMIVPRGQTREFLAECSVRELPDTQLYALLLRLGVRTLGDFASLDASAVAARFGPDGTVAHRLAQGLDPTPIVAHEQDVELFDDATLDPPADRVDVAVFAARQLTDKFLQRLRSGGLLATVIEIETETEHGETLARQWRHEEGFDESSLIDRLRWQLDGWLSGTSHSAPTAGVQIIRIEALQSVSSGGVQSVLWGGASDADRRAERGFARVQAMLGAEAVQFARTAEGRSPRERVRLLSWGEVPSTQASRDFTSRHVAPWPACIPIPSPTIVSTVLRAVDVVSAAGFDIDVSYRGELSDVPRVLIIDRTEHIVAAVAGPWPHEDRWWDSALKSRRAFLQLQVEEGTGYLVFRERSQWWLEAMYR